MSAQTFIDLLGANPGASATDSLEFGQQWSSVRRFFTRDSARIPRD
jgi:hypothetical protein